MTLPPQRASARSQEDESETLGQDRVHMSRKTERKKKALLVRMKQPSLVKKILLMNAHKVKRMLEMKKRKMAQLKFKKKTRT